MKRMSAKVYETATSHEKKFSSVRGVLKERRPFMLTSLEATKCINKTHGYESTLAGVDASLQRFQFGRPIQDIRVLH